MKVLAARAIDPFSIASRAHLEQDHNSFSDSSHSSLQGDTPSTPVLLSGAPNPLSVLTPLQRHPGN